jgi:hypothetical protein
MHNGDYGWRRLLVPPGRVAGTSLTEAVVQCDSSEQPLLTTAIFDSSLAQEHSTTIVRPNTGDDA